MTLRAEIRNAIGRWKELTFYQRIEQTAVLILTALIAVIVVAALWNLVLRVSFSLILAGSFDPTDHSTFQSVFGSVFTVIIALEFKRSILVITERHDTIFQAKTVILIALLAVLRKFIIIDFDSTDASKVFALSAGTLALGAIYWALRDQDDRRAARRSRPRAEG